MNETMPHWLTKQAYVLPNKVAIELENGQEMTFVQLKEASESFARKLASLGIQSGSRVAMLATNHVDMVIALHALTYLEAVAVMLNVRLTDEELIYQMEQADVSLLLTTDCIKKQKQLSFSRQKTFIDIHQLQEGKVDLVEDIRLDAPFTMMFTSGTTGKPKGVLHTYGNHWWSAIGSVLNLGLQEHDKWLLTLPIFHVGGLSILIRSVLYGMTVYLMEGYDKDSVYEALLEKEVTIASFVTLMLQHFIDTLGEKEIPSHVRCILLGGGSVPETVLEKVEEKRIPLFQSYGMTETSSQIVTLSAQDARKKLGSAGKPLFPAKVTIAHPQSDGVGEIVVKGPMVIDGYANQLKANKHSFQNGWFKTGDVGYFDEEGFLYVVDRRTDLIISGGENIYPSEIEHVLLQLDAIKEVAVVGVSDEVWGQVPVAFIVKNKEITTEEIQTYAKKRIASFKVPKEVFFIENLPRNASNKIMRHRLVANLDSSI